MTDDTDSSDTIDVGEDVDTDVKGVGEDVDTTKTEDRNLRQRTRDYFTADEDTEEGWGAPAAGTRFSRRGFVTGAGAAVIGAGVLGYGATEADLLNEDPAAPAPPAVDETPTPTPEPGVAIERENEYRFDSEQELKEATPEDWVCNPSPGNYLATFNSDEVEDLLTEGDLHGTDPTGTLNSEERAMDLGDITPHQGLYALDVDRRSTDDGEEYGFFVQIVGQEEGGVYATRGAAVEMIDELERQDDLEGFYECT